MSKETDIEADINNLKVYISDVRHGRMNTELEIDSASALYSLSLEAMQLRDTLMGASDFPNECKIPIAEMLNQKMREMEILLAAQQAMSASLDMDRVLELIIAECKEVMRAEAASMIVVNLESQELTIMLAEGPKGEKVKNQKIPPHQGIAGWVADNGIPLLVPDVLKDPRFYQSMDRNSGFITKSILCVPMRYKNAVTGVLEVLNKVGDGEFSESEISLFQGLANLSAIAFENARMSRELVIQEGMNRELSIAHDIQMELLPQSAPIIPGFDIFGVTYPAKQVGGDYFDFIELDSNRLGIAMADVSGKGVPAGLYMTMVRSLLHAISRDVIEPRDVICRLNRELYGDIKTSSFVTMIYMELDTSTGKVKLVNAGHLPALVVGDGEQRQLKAFVVPLGILPPNDFNSIVEQEEFILGRGDVMMLYTDGVTEARFGDDLYGDDRLIEFAQRARNLAAREMIESLITEVKSPPGTPNQNDDITVIVARRLP